MKLLTDKYTDFVLEFVMASQSWPAMDDWTRLAKVMEELGETAEALIRYEGNNPRKERLRAVDVADEYGDVIMTALAGMVALGFDPNDVLERQMEKTQERFL